MEISLELEIFLIRRIQQFLICKTSQMVSIEFSVTIKIYSSHKLRKTQTLN